MMFDMNIFHGFSDFTPGVNSEIRLHRNSVKSVVFSDGRLLRNTVASAVGVSARVYKNGAYGFASAPACDIAGIKEVLRSARENAFLLASRQNGSKAQLPPLTAYTETNRHPAPDTSEQKSIIEFCGALDAYIASKYPDLASRTVAAPCLNTEKLLMTSDGVKAHSFTPRSTLYIILTKQDSEGNMQELAEPVANYGCFNELFSEPEDYYETIERLYARLTDKCGGIYAEPGIKDVILAPDLTGILAHEAVGHTVEADFVLSGSVAAHNMNRQVASDIVNITDFANTAFGKQCPVPVYTDDEGVKAKDVKIIENGYLRSYMHNRESALHFGVEPTGNARAYSIADEPIIRMRNTAILPGNSKTEDMIASVEDGYYFIKTGNGQADATGEFMFGVDVGYEIKHGKLGRAIKSTTISGIAFEMLKTVDMVSDEFEWNCAGMCGKKQRIPVSTGGPSIKCKINVGGR